jgi:hypothetical protein
MGDVGQASKKKAKPTSWQRRKAAKLGTSAAGADVPVSKPKKQLSESKAAELALWETCAQAKAASSSARERYRLGQPAEPGDDHLAAQYSKARAALKQFMPENGHRAAKSAQATTGDGGAAPASKKRKTLDGSVPLEAGGSEDIQERGNSSAHPVEGEAAAATAPEAETISRAAAVPTVVSGSKRQQRAAAAAAALNGEGERWTCSLCEVTILVRPDGRAREQHLAGKAHAKRERAAASAAPADARPAGDGKPMYTCRLCACTLALGAGGSHAAGARHRDRVAQLALFLASHADGASSHDAEPLKRGDWVCCLNHAPQLVYASRSVCCRARCGGTREQGLSQQEAASIAAAAQPRPATSGGSGGLGTAQTGKGGLKGRATQS